MKNDPLRQFTNLRKALLKEKATIHARLAEIDKALGTPAESSQPVSVPSVTADEPAPGVGKPKRKVSQATRAKMAASQRARRAGAKPAASAPAPAAKAKKEVKAKKKRDLSPAARAAMSAAAKIRWAKKRAAQPF